MNELGVGRIRAAPAQAAGHGERGTVIVSADARGKAADARLALGRGRNGER